MEAAKLPITVHALIFSPDDWTIGDIFEGLQKLTPPELVHGFMLTTVLGLSRSETFGVNDPWMKHLDLCGQAFGSEIGRHGVDASRINWDLALDEWKQMFDRSPNPLDGIPAMGIRYTLERIRETLAVFADQGRIDETVSSLRVIEETVTKALAGRDDLPPEQYQA